MLNSRKVVVEFLGTMLLTMSLCVTALLAGCEATDSGFASVLFFMATAFAAISVIGWMQKEMSIEEMLRYMFAQVEGAIFAIVVVNIILNVFGNY